MAMVSFKRGTYAEFAAKIATASADTIYFCTDTKQLFVGSSEYTKGAKVINAEPTSSTEGNVGTLYAYNGSLYLCTAADAGTYTYIRVANVSDVVDTTYTISSTAAGSITLTPSAGDAQTIDINGWSDLATKADITAVFKFKGTKATVADLPTSGAVVGDVWYVTATQGEYVCTATDPSVTWEEFGPAIDLTGYVEKVSGATAGNIPELAADGSIVDSGKTLGVSVPADAVFTDTTYEVATSSSDGLMSSGMVTKLEGIEAGAQVNTITGVKGDAENDYRTGDVNITAANLGITMAVADINAIPTVYATKEELSWQSI